MSVPFPGSQISIVQDRDGVRRFTSSERQSQPSRILAVVDRVPYTRDPSGTKHAYVPFSSAVVRPPNWLNAVNEAYTSTSP